MNSLSLAINGHKVDLALFAFEAGSRPSTPPGSSVRPAWPATRVAHPRPRPPKRQGSGERPGWYNSEGGPSLADIQQRNKTLVKRWQKYTNDCGKIVVMGLMSPTPMLLFLFNPIALAFWTLLCLCWTVAKIEGGSMGTLWVVL